MKQILFVLAFFSGFAAFAEEPDVFTNVYVVPPTFLNPQVERHPTAREILFNAGIDFPEGTSAVYNAATSQLIVRTTQDRMALVEKYIESLVPQVEKQIYITIRELEFAEKPEFFSQWDHPGIQPQGDVQKSSRVYGDRVSFLEALSQPPRTDFPATTAAKRGMIAVFTDPQFQVMIRTAMKELKSTEIPAASVMVLSGQPAIIQVDARRWGVVPVLGADEFTIDLEYYLPVPGEAFFPAGPGSRDPDSVTIWDGQTVAWAEEKKDGSYRVVFITAHLMDPAGMPVNDAKTRNAPPSRDPVDLSPTNTEAKDALPPSVQERAQENLLSPRAQALVDLADEAALRGSELLAEGDLEAAGKYYELSLFFLPEVELTEPRREAIRKQFERTQAVP